MHAPKLLRRIVPWSFGGLQRNGSLRLGIFLLVGFLDRLVPPPAFLGRYIVVRIVVSGAGTRKKEE